MNPTTAIDLRSLPQVEAQSQPRAQPPAEGQSLPQAEALPLEEQDIRDYLDSLHRLRLRVRALKEREAFFFRLAASTAYRDEAHLPANPVGDNVSLAVDHAWALRRQAEILIQREREAERWIARLSNQRHRDVLTLRYLNGWRYDRIASALEVSSGRAHAMQREAMRLLVQCREESPA